MKLLLTKTFIALLDHSCHVTNTPSSFISQPPHSKYVPYVLTPNFNVTVYNAIFELKDQ